jgi:hypothetical protein
LVLLVLLVLPGATFLLGIYATEHRWPIYERVRSVKRAWRGGAIEIKVLPVDAAASTIRALRQTCDEVLHRGRPLPAADLAHAPGTYVCRRGAWPVLYVFSPQLMERDRSATDPPTVRAELRRTVLPPAPAPVFEEVGGTAPTGPAARCRPNGTPLTRRYHYTLDGFSSTIDVLGGGGRKLVIYHGDHGGVRCDVIEKLLGAGHRVAVLDMPLVGANAGAIRKPWGGQTLIATTHKHLGVLEGDDFQPVRLFVEPVVRVVEAMHREHPTIAMIGSSGGAWTTTLACALEPRIGLCMAVSGSTPLHAVSTRDMGDWEQVTPTLFNEFTYEDYYLASAHPPGRMSFVVRNRLDPCCHSTPLPPGTRRLLDDYTVRHGLRLSLILDLSPGHGISERTLTTFLGLLAER